jgi:hypothetical protein
MSWPKKPSKNPFKDPYNQISLCKFQKLKNLSLHNLSQNLFQKIESISGDQNLKKTLFRKKGPINQIY